MLTPYFENDLVTLYQGDCRAVLRELTRDPAWKRVHSVVCDPPYELGFMSKSWDSRGVSFDFVTWRQVAYAMLPGAYLLAFGGTRTMHRITCAIEDAGLDITDSIYWCTGQGFPKSTDVSKQIDKMAGVERAVVGKHPSPARSIYGNGEMPADVDVTTPTTSSPKKWSGWGSALKPSVEPCVLAQKPIDGTIAGNVLRHGAGALNIDASRVGDGGQLKWEAPRGGIWQTDPSAVAAAVPSQLGRWPANLLTDGSPEVEACFPNAKGMSSGGAHKSGSKGGMFGAIDSTATARGDDGSASRFFKACAFEEGEEEHLRRLVYCAKASRAERDRGLDTSEHVTYDETEPWEPEDRNRSIRVASVTSPSRAITDNACGTPHLKRRVRYLCTCSFGNVCTVRSLTGFRCITSTETGKTTASKISNASTRLRTSDCTRDAKSSMVFGGNRASSVANGSQSTRAIGISVAKDGRSMGGAGDATSRKLSSQNASAHNVGDEPGKEVRVAVRHNVHPT